MRRSIDHLLLRLSRKPALKKEISMSTLIRSVLVAAALFGTVSAASAGPYDTNDNSSKPYAQRFFEDLHKSIGVGY